MSIRKFLIILLMALATIGKAENKQLTNNSKVVVFTCTKGDELYAGFGHNALWISDPDKGIDRLFNYGTFDFETPNFYTKFIRGKLYYMLSVTTVRRFINEYNYRKIGVIGQTLDLTLADKQAVYDFMEKNYLPENRFYKYDFFYDNCATRIRDVIFNEVDGKLNINSKAKDLSLRELLFPYMTHTPWTKFGINFILGLAADKPSSNWSCMYLPELMQNEFNHTTIETATGTHNLVKEEIKYLDLKLDFSNNKYDDPLVVFGLILIMIIILSVAEIKKGFHLKWLDNLLFSVSVIVGVFLLFMWVGTDHMATKCNLNMLWLFPAQALFLFAINNRKRNGMTLLAIALGYQLAICVIMFIWPQNAELSFMLIALTFGVRISTYYWKMKKAI